MGPTVFTVGPRTLSQDFVATYVGLVFCATYRGIFAHAESPLIKIA
jgi:hypothetical protein